MMGRLGVLVAFTIVGAVFAPAAQAGRVTVSPQRCETTAEYRIASPCSIRVNATVAQAERDCMNDSGPINPDPGPQPVTWWEEGCAVDVRTAQAAASQFCHSYDRRAYHIGVAVGSKAVASCGVVVRVGTRNVAVECGEYSEIPEWGLSYDGEGCVAHAASADAVAGCDRTTVYPGITTEVCLVSVQLASGVTCTATTEETRPSQGTPGVDYPFEPVVPELDCPVA